MGVSNKSYPFYKLLRSFPSNRAPVYEAEAPFALPLGQNSKEPKPSQTLTMREVHFPTASSDSITDVYLTIGGSFAIPLSQ